MNTASKIRVLQSIDKKYIQKNMDNMLKELGGNINFCDNTWLCNNATNTPSIDSNIKIYFNSIPEKYREYVKYYVLLSNNKLSTRKSDVQNIGVFLRYIKEYENYINLININQALIMRYRKYLDEKYSVQTTKVKKMNVLVNFFSELEGWEDMPKDNPVNKRIHLYKRKKSDNELKTRYIPKNVMDKIDKLFFSEEIPVHFRLFYWICRLYPSRSSEISSLPIDCIKKVGDKYVFFKNEEKSSNEIGDSNLITIYIKYDDMGKYLIELYTKQKEMAKRLSTFTDERFHGQLFLYRPIYGKSREGKLQKRVCLVSGTIFNKYLQDICKKKGIDKEIKDGVQLCTHSLRHNGITDRLYENFSTVHIRDLTGQKTDKEVIQNYHHRQKDKIEELEIGMSKERFFRENNIIDEKVKSKSELQRNKPINSKIIFRGRIMNLDKNREERILSNKKAYQIGFSDKTIGICTDIVSCKSGVFNCLKCNDFAPDSNEINFFRNQLIEWTEKAEYFELKGNICMLKYALEVKSLFEKIVKNIEYLN